MIEGAQRTITEAVTAWEGVVSGPHRFGGIEYRLDTREIGHVHGDRWIDVPFPKRVRDELVDRGRAAPHHLLPDSGWISFWIRTEQDVAHAIDLLATSYELAQEQRRRRAERERTAPRA